MRSVKMRTKTFWRFWTDRKNHRYYVIYIFIALLRQIWITVMIVISVLILVVMHSTVLPGNGSVVHCKVYKGDRKGHGAHCQNIHHFEG